ncbi:MAG: mechanosensitive ion channel family protein [Planctomycetota bacterium]|jgi:MscS family membrane protein|nr:mechanosensitive ion channel family protein [Planctomycetota bacterium]
MIKTLNPSKNIRMAALAIFLAWIPIRPEMSPPGSAARAAEPAAEADESEREAAEKRSQEREAVVGEAKEFIHNVDETVREALPGNLGLLSDTTILGVPLWRYLAMAALLFLGGCLMVLTGRHFRKVRAEIQAGSGRGTWQRLWDILFLALANPAKLIIFALVLRGVSGLAVTAIHPDVIWISNLLLSLSLAVYFFDLVGLVDAMYGERLFQSGDRLMLTMRPLLFKIIRIIILLIAGMQIYESVTGQTMLSLIAGLGIGGLALALASQETLKNLLGFASIALDKAFLVGDSVIISGFDGKVSHVGLRSLRLETADGSTVVIPNATAINSNIVNKSRRRRVKLEIQIGLGLTNPFPKVEAALIALRELLENSPGGAPDERPEVRVLSYGPGRLTLQAVFWFDPNYPAIQAETDRLYLETGKRLADLGIGFA